MRKAIAGTLVCVLLSGTTAVAVPQMWNGPLSMHDAIVRAETAGFGPRTAASAAQSAYAGVRQQRAGILPQVGISATALNGNLAQLGMPLAKQRYVSLTATVPLLPLQPILSMRSLTAGAQASDFDVLTAKNDAALSAAQAYLQVETSDALIAARTQALNEQRENVRLTQARVSAGKMARFVLARDQAALALAEQSLQDASAQRDETLNDLKFALDFDIGSRVDVSETLHPSTLEGDIAAYETRALAQRPEVLAARKRLEAATFGVSAAHAAYIPQAALSGQTYSGSSSPNLGAAGSQVAVSATLPVFDGGARSAAVAKAEADRSSSMIALEQAALSVQRDVANAWRELIAARRNLASAQANMRSSQEQLRVSLLRRAAGKAIYLEVLDSLSTVAGARESVISAQARENLAILLVHRASGDPMDALVL